MYCVLGSENAEERIVLYRGDVREGCPAEMGRPFTAPAGMVSKALISMV